MKNKSIWQSISLAHTPSFQQPAAEDFPHRRMHLGHCWTPRASLCLTHPFLSPFIALATPQRPVAMGSTTASHTVWTKTTSFCFHETSSFHPTFCCSYYEKQQTCFTFSESFLLFRASSTLTSPLCSGISATAPQSVCS